MSNPMNSSVLIGRIVSHPIFSATKDGREFAVDFTLAVKRNYRNKGEYLVDYIPVRYEGENRMGFAHTLSVGETISAAGAIYTGSYKDKNTGEKRYFWKLLAENITPMAVQNATYN